MFGRSSKVPTRKGRFLSRKTRPTFIALLLQIGCNQTEATNQDDATKPAVVQSEVEPPPQSFQTRRTDYLAWIDPDAITVAYTDLPEIDWARLSVILGVPPRVTKVFEKAQSVPRRLEVLLPSDGPSSQTWFTDDAIGMQARADGTVYVLRRLARPAQEVQRELANLGFHTTKEQGFDVLYGHRTFPWRIVFLDASIVGFMPARLGVSMGPLTAGRDLPPSEIGRQLAERLKSSTIVVDTYALGPMLHLELTDSVEQLGVHGRRVDQGLELVVQFATTNDPSASLEELRDRDLAFESDQIQALAQRVDFSLDQGAILGRVELRADDTNTLRSP